MLCGEIKEEHFGPNAKVFHSAAGLMDDLELMKKSVSDTSAAYMYLTNPDAHCKSSRLNNKLDQSLITGPGLGSIKKNNFTG